MLVYIYFSLNVKQFFAYVNHAQIRSWNQPVLSNWSNVSCSRKQQGPLMGLELTSQDALPTAPRSLFNASVKCDVCN